MRDVWRQASRFLMAGDKKRPAACVRAGRRLFEMGKDYLMPLINIQRISHLLHLTIK